MECKICGYNAKNIFRDRILNKYDCKYYYCDTCGCIFTEAPYWLDEAYSEAIALTDTGILVRNDHLCNNLLEILHLRYSATPYVLDYGAGYGLMVRRLRDNGVNAFWYDRYCENIFAKGFEYRHDSKPDVVIAFEVAEHLENPKLFFDEALTLSDTLVIATELMPSIETVKGIGDWWYFSPETGQHIFFYSRATFKKYAELSNCAFYSYGGFQVLTRDKDLSRMLERRKGFKVGLVPYRVMEKARRILSNAFSVKKIVPYDSLTWTDHQTMVDVFKRRDTSGLHKSGGK